MIKNTIEFETTRKDLTHLSGLTFFQKLVKSTGLDGVIGHMLPNNKWLRAQSNKEKFFTALYSFIAGADCLEDLETLKLDPLFWEVANNPCSSITMGRFLRSFQPKTLENLRNYLPKLAYQLRNKLYPNEPLIISMDATDHVQHGQYMEGVEWNYKDHWCLDSQNAFDQFGLCYGWKLRSGATHSSVGAVEMIESIFRNVPHKGEKYFRADSAYSSLAIYNSLLNNDVRFAICLKENVWRSLLNRYGNTIKWKKTDLSFFKSNKCHIGSCLYPVKGLAGRSFLRVVFIRAKKDKLKPGESEYYRYYAIVTDLSERKMKDEAVVRFYMKRANVENQIKDLKYGMDFKHFPCQKFSANQAWGLIGIYAYNLMRFSSHKLYKGRGCFLKTVRRRMLYIASEMRKGQRKIKLRFTNHMYQEVKHLELMIAQLGFYRSSSGADGPPA